jgi:hypothetical protein
VEQALPIIAMFAGLVGHGRLARYRVAMLRELAVLPRARLPIRAIHDSVPWMEQSSATRLVRDLRGAGLLAYDSRAETYQLTREARVVAAVCGALTTARVDYTRIIKILAATMRLADAMNAPAQVAYAMFAFTLVNTLAEDKRFELLRVSPTRFPSLLLAVRQQSGPCVTRHDRTQRTVPTAAERPRMRRKLRRTGHRPAG